MKKIIIGFLLVFSLAATGWGASQDFKGTVNGNTITAGTGTVTMSAGKTLTVTESGTIDEAVALSTKAPKTSVISFDTTAGRVLRSFALRFEPGGTPNTNINITPSLTTTTPNTPAITGATDLAASGTSGSFSLSSDGLEITLNITPAIIGVVSITITMSKINSAGTVPYYIFVGGFSSGNALIYIKPHGGTAGVDWRTVLDASDIIEALFTVVTDS